MGSVRLFLVSTRLFHETHSMKGMHMRTIAFAVAMSVLGIGGYLVFGSHVGQWFKDAKNAVTDSTSDSHVIGMAEEAMSQAEAELKTRYADVYDVNLKVAKLEPVAEQQRTALAKEERILKRAQELLGQSKPGSALMIGYASYAWDAVNGDILNRVSFCRVLRTNIQNNELALNRLKAAYADGMERIRQKRDELKKKQMEFEAEKAELAALRAQAYVNQVVGKIYSAGDIKLELGEAREAFERRLNTLRANAQYDQEFASKSSAVSTWNAELGLPTETAAEAVKAYFQATTESAPVNSPIGVGEALEKLEEKKL